MNTSLLASYYGTNFNEFDHSPNFIKTSKFNFNMNSPNANNSRNDNEIQTSLEIDHEIKNKFNFVIPAISIEVSKENDEEEIRKDLDNLFGNFGIIKFMELKKEKKKIKAYILYEYYFSALFAYDTIKELIDEKEGETKFFIELLTSTDKKENILQSKKKSQNNLRDMDTGKKSIEEGLEKMSISNISLEERNIEELSFSKKKNIFSDEEIYTSGSFFPKTKLFPNSNGKLPFYYEQNSQVCSNEKENQSQNYFKGLFSPSYFNQNQTNQFFCSIFSGNNFSNFQNCQNINECNRNSFYDRTSNISFFDRCYPFFINKTIDNYDFKTSNCKEYINKYVCNYAVQIENDQYFQVKLRILGPKGCYLKKIIYDSCIGFKDFTTKVRLRGKGSGYREGEKNEESDEPLQLCISSLNKGAYFNCCEMVEDLLNKIYDDFSLWVRMNHLNLKVPEKINKYEFVVNRGHENE